MDEAEFHCKVCKVLARKKCINTDDKLCSACQRFYQRACAKPYETLICKGSGAGCERNSKQSCDGSLSNHWRFFCTKCRFDKCRQVVGRDVVPRKREKNSRRPRTSSADVSLTLMSGNANVENETILKCLVLNVDDFIKKRLNMPLRIVDNALPKSGEDFMDIVRMNFKISLKASTELFRSMPFFSEISIPDRCKMFSNFYMQLAIFEAWATSHGGPSGMHKNTFEASCLIFPELRQASLENNWLRTLLPPGIVYKTELALLMCFIILNQGLSFYFLLHWLCFVNKCIILQFR